MSRSSAENSIRIATRESPLALWQANFVADEIRRVAPGQCVELVPLSTLGDRDRVEPLRQFGGLGVFTREVQKAVLDKNADIAVHSLKDLPTDPLEGLCLAGIPPRAARFDALVLPAGRQGNLQSLTAGARIGTGSPRRRSQLLRLRPDLALQEIRGNIDTRLRKLDEGEFDAVILAEAGLRRLGLDDRIAQILSPPVLYPAVGQAALGIECRADDVGLRQILARLSCPQTQAEVLSERACLRALRAGCHAPVGVLSSVAGSDLVLQAVVLSLDGVQCFTATARGALSAPEDVGSDAATQLLSAGAGAVL